MPVFTAPDGSPVQIDARAVIRISRPVRSDLDHASCRIDWKHSDLVRESVPEVLELLSYELNALVKLTGSSNQPVWINANKAEGPFPPSKDEASKGIGCHLIVMGETQHLMEDQATVEKLLANASDRS